MLTCIGCGQVHATLERTERTLKALLASSEAREVMRAQERDAAITRVSQIKLECIRQTEDGRAELAQLEERRHYLHNQNRALQCLLRTEREETAQLRAEVKRWKQETCEAIQDLRHYAGDRYYERHYAALAAELDITPGDATT